MLQELEVSVQLSKQNNLVPILQYSKKIDSIFKYRNKQIEHQQQMLRMASRTKTALANSNSLSLLYRNMEHMFWVSMAPQ
jgi:hypothetical protein